MLGKRQRSVIGKLSELLVSGSRAALFDLPDTSPRGPLDPKALQSPRGPKNYDLGGVGLGIVAALERSAGADRGVCRPRVTRTGPARVGSDRTGACFDDSENYTYVTCYRPNRQSVTKVYYNSGKLCSGGLTESRPSQEADVPAFHVSDFLSSCNSCGKKLHGEDIYMYRGEKAFCSTECRSRQITIDERKERCRSRAADLSTSPYAEGQIFSMGILAI